MFGLDPLSRPVAIAEILLLLSFAAFVGWLLGRLVLNGRINVLRATIASKETELAECRQSGGISAPTRTEPSGEAPPAYVPADPLLPAYRHDDSPGVTLPDPVAGNRAPVSPPVEKESAAPEPYPSTRPDNSEAAVLSRIAARAHEINFDRIGRATAAEADDLKDIVGIGPFLERKLHSLSIYTYRQIANFTTEDVNTVNRIIEFFPGRIERDNWVDQARAFQERKYGRRNGTHE